MINRPTQDDGRVHGVIVGMCRDDGRWLLIRRSAHVAAPGKVCFPGGAIEPGESRRLAAIREVREEVGLPIIDLRQVWHDRSSDRPLTLWGYLGRAEHFNARAQPHEVDELLWLGEREIRACPDLLGNTLSFFDALLSARGNGHQAISTAGHQPSGHPRGQRST
ncbi:MAG: NUDIX domain-containing protein [Phycisphaeraceae bacterium]|nr:NUDIX domain-containing protein [Phycisphaeraceae bacterium]